MVVSNNVSLAILAAMQHAVALVVVASSQQTNHFLFPNTPCKTPWV